MMAPFVLILKSAPVNIRNVFCLWCRMSLTKANVLLTDLDALAFGAAPGSFTGVRIGIGIAQGLALGAELPMIGVSTLATMAQGAWRKTGATRVLAAIDARMGEVYWAEYQARRAGRLARRRDRSGPQAGGRQRASAAAGGKLGNGWHRLAGVARSGEGLLADLKPTAKLSCPAAEDMLPLACHLLSRRKNRCRRARRAGLFA
ncbi:UGMP family protein [Raoultella terrigena]|uniref:tRNA threonylcarbamoyladenosine biosynthesis protein TsaB n=1 Tax=Raoultella terrigena TaxID=577 RepID=A0A4U9D1C5_RAOTE|nr:UGMP family protein [Raoultella terrigena]